MLEFLSLLVFPVILVSVFLVFVLVFMFVRVYDSRERSTRSAASKERHENQCFTSCCLHLDVEIKMCINVS